MTPPRSNTQTPTPQQRLALNIREARQRASISQAGLAAKMREQGATNWHQTTVSRVESGAQGVRTSEAIALMKILGNGIIAGTGVDDMLNTAQNAMQDARTLMEHHGVTNLADVPGWPEAVEQLGREENAASLRKVAADIREQAAALDAAAEKLRADAESLEWMTEALFNG